VATGKTRRAPLAEAIPRPQKRTAGRTRASETPVAIRAIGARLDDDTREHVRRRLGRALGKHALHVERVTVRVRDVNGPRGGVDQLCSVKVVLSGRPSVVAEERGRTPRLAFDRAAAVAERAVRRSLERAGLRAPRGKQAKGGAGRSEAGAAPARAASQGPEDGSLIGRRVGRSEERLRRVAARPEKERRDAWVDTAQPGTSASDRKVGAGSTARRNTKLDRSGMTSMLEDSAQDRPSRKSTRRSTGRARRDTGLRLRAESEARAPSTRARKGRVRGPRRR
jgi:hypothetical protein